MMVIWRLTRALTQPNLCSIISGMGSAAAETGWTPTGPPAPSAPRIAPVHRTPGAYGAPGSPGAPGASPVPGLPGRPGWPEADGAGTLPGLPVLPALRGLLPRGGLARGSVLAMAEFGLLCLALAAAPSADAALWRIA